ncbi:Scr1 family TA system antitoxin-like transcriptional regulator [Micromonospora sp. M12]
MARRGHIPHPRTRIAVAQVLGRDAADLWPEPFRRRDLPWFRPWAELEQDATGIRWYEPLLVPGLLQTEGTPARCWAPVGCSHRPRWI